MFPIHNLHHMHNFSPLSITTQMQRDRSERIERVLQMTPYITYLIHSLSSINHIVWVETTTAVRKNKNEKRGKIVSCFLPTYTAKGEGCGEPLIEGA